MPTPRTYRSPQHKASCARHRLIVDKITKTQATATAPGYELTSYFCATPDCKNAGDVVAYTRREV